MAFRLDRKACPLTMHDEVYVQPFPIGGKSYRVSVNGGHVPHWSADGRELFFVTPAAEIASVRVTAAGSTFSCSVPTMLFHLGRRDTDGCQPLLQYLERIRDPW